MYIHVADALHIMHNSKWILILTYLTKKIIRWSYSMCCLDDLGVCSYHRWFHILANVEEACSNGYMEEGATQMYHAQKEKKFFLPCRSSLQILLLLPLNYIFTFASFKFIGTVQRIWNSRTLVWKIPTLYFLTYFYSTQTSFNPWNLTLECSSIQITSWHTCCNRMYTLCI